MLTLDQLEEQIESTIDTPVKDIILVLRVSTTETTASGIHKGGVTTAEEAKEQAKLYVIALPEGAATLFPYDLTDIVKASRYATTDIESVIPGYEVGMVRTHDVMTYRPFECKKCEVTCEGCK